MNENQPGIGGRPRDPDRAAGDPEDPSQTEVDFTDQPLHVSAQEAVEDGEVYFPPTDPVITTDAEGRAEVLGGFSTSAMSEIDVPPSAEDNQPGDDALETAVLEELRRDSATTDLTIRVHVRNGVAYLRGSVPSLDDAENAESVASRVPGVREVVEDLRVPDR